MLSEAAKRRRAEYTRAWNKTPAGRASQKRSRDKRKFSGKALEDERRRIAKGQSLAAIAAKKRWTERNRAKHNVSATVWAKANKDFYAAYSAWRTRKLKRFPLSPAHQAEIDGLYLFCKIFPKFEVDHIVPVTGRRVSGLHVPWNLQAITRAENRRKSNKYEELAA